MRYCPHCAYCEIMKSHEKKIMEEKLQANIDINQTRQLEREKMEKALAAKERSIREDGPKYGENFAAYSLDDIRQVQNYDFFVSYVHVRQFVALRGTIRVGRDLT